MDHTQPCMGTGGWGVGIPYENRDGLSVSWGAKSSKMLQFKIPPSLKAITLHISYGCSKQSLGAQQ